MLRACSSQSNPGVVGCITDTPALATKLERGALSERRPVCYDVAGKAVLVRTGWDRHWRTDAYVDGSPCLTADAAEHLEILMTISSTKLHRSSLEPGVRMNGASVLIVVSFSRA